jgi:hypothetical protein
MATSPVAVNTGIAPKAKRKRSPSVAKPAFFIIQIMDENGQPMQFDKKRVKLLKVERSADQVLDMVESGEHPHAFYLRGIVPVARQAAPRATPSSATPAPAQTPTAA